MTGLKCHAVVGVSQQVRWEYFERPSRSRNVVRPPRLVDVLVDREQFDFEDEGGEGWDGGFCSTVTIG